jgi:hypothetical protein
MKRIVESDHDLSDVGCAERDTRDQLAGIIFGGAQVSAATITGWWVGVRLPPCGSGVTKI